MTATAIGIANGHFSLDPLQTHFAHHFALLPRSGVSAGNSSAIQATAKTESTATFLTAFWLNAAIFGGELLAFSLLRPAFKSIYEARSYDAEEEARRKKR